MAMDSRAGAEDRHAGRGQRPDQVDRRLPPNWAITPSRPSRSCSTTLSVVFQRQRLEVEAVAEVEVGADGLRVGVDHDGSHARRAQRLRGVHRAVVELDALADADRAAAEHDRPSGRPAARPRSPARRSSRSRASPPRTRRRRCRPSCRSAGCRPPLRARADDGFGRSPLEGGDLRVAEAEALGGGQRLRRQGRHECAAPSASIVAKRSMNQGSIAARGRRRPPRSSPAARAS